MIISIGSRSLPKVAAVSRAFSRYPELWINEDSVQFVIIPKEERGTSKGIEVDKISKISCSPLTLEETLLGAQNRAKEAYNYAQKSLGKCSYGVGVEAGVFPVSGINTGYFDTTVVAIYDGQEFFYGTSPMFEYPKAVIKRIVNGEEAGLIIDFFGETAKGREGVIGPLTNNRVYRDDFEEVGVLMAIAQIIRKDLYTRDN